MLCWCETAALAAACQCSKLMLRPWLMALARAHAMRECAQLGECEFIASLTPARCRAETTYTVAARAVISIIPPAFIKCCVLCTYASALITAPQYAVCSRCTQPMCGQQRPRRFELRTCRPGEGAVLGRPLMELIWTGDILGTNTHTCCARAVIFLTPINSHRLRPRCVLGAPADTPFARRPS